MSGLQPVDPRMALVVAQLVQAAERAAWLIEAEGHKPQLAELVIDVAAVLQRRDDADAMSFVFLAGGILERAQSVLRQRFDELERAEPAARASLVKAAAARMLAAEYDRLWPAPSGKERGLTYGRRVEYVIERLPGVAAAFEALCHDFGGPPPGNLDLTAKDRQVKDYLLSRDAEPDPDINWQSGYFVRAGVGGVPEADVDPLSEIGA